MVPRGRGATLAFADFVRPILEAKTVKYKQTVEMKGPPATMITSQEMVLDATRSRSEIMLPGGGWSRCRSRTGAKESVFALSPGMKHATILEYANTKTCANDPTLWLRLLQTARDGKTEDFHCEPLGEKQLMGAASWGSE